MTDQPELPDEHCQRCMKPKQMQKDDFNVCGCGDQPEPNPTAWEAQDAYHAKLRSEMTGETDALKGETNQPEPMSEAERQAKVAKAINFASHAYEANMNNHSPTGELLCFALLEQTRRLEAMTRERDNWEKHVDDVISLIPMNSPDEGCDTAMQRILSERANFESQLAAMTERAEGRKIQCIFCHEDFETLSALRDHSAVCEKHPAVIAVYAREAECDTFREQAKRAEADCAAVRYIIEINKDCQFDCPRCNYSEPWWTDTDADLSYKKLDSDHPGSALLAELDTLKADNAALADAGEYFLKKSAGLMEELHQSPVDEDDHYEGVIIDDHPGSSLLEDLELSKAYATEKENQVEELVKRNRELEARVVELESRKSASQHLKEMFPTTERARVLYNESIPSHTHNLHYVAWSELSDFEKQPWLEKARAEKEPTQ